MGKAENDKCPNCGKPLNPNEIRCSTCEYPAQSTKEEWKPANMGKQGGKPKANRTGKK